MNVRSVKFEENTNIGYVIFTTSCKRESTAISRFEKALSDYDSCFTESMFKAFMSIKPCGYVDGLLAWSGSSVINEEYEIYITYLDGTYSLTIYFLPALLKKDTTDTTEDTTDTTEDTTDTTEDTTDTTEDTTDTTEDTTDTTEDTTDTTEDTTDPTEDTTEVNAKYTVALGLLDDILVTCLSFKWCHAPFDTSKSCYNCAFYHSCDTSIKYSFTTDNFQIVPTWVYSEYNINPLTALIYALVKYLNLKEMYVSPRLYPTDSDGIIIIDDVFFSEEMPF